MKILKIFTSVFLLFILIQGVNIYSQSDAPLNPVIVTQGTPHPSELNTVQKPVETPEFVNQWSIELQKARWNNDYYKARDLQQKIDKYYGYKETDYSTTPLDRPVAEQTDPREMPLGDWYNTDILVYSGGLRSDGYRQLAIKNGDDGNLYAVINTNAANSNTKLYRSTNKGISWSNIGTVTFGSNYAQSVNIAFADSGSINRITLLISYGTQAPPTRNGSIWYCSWRTDGTYFQTSLVQSPPSGQGFRDPTIITDGLYYSAGSTYFYGAYVAVNSSGVTQAVYVTRSVSFGTSWTTYNTITSGYDDQYPFVDFKQILSGAESLYVVTSRVFSTTSAGIRIYKQSIGSMGSGFATVFLTSGGNYRKPSFAIRHSTSNTTNNQMLITCTNNDNGVYHFSTNAGVSWTLDATLALGNENPVAFTNCVLDPQDATNYAKAVFIANGDSVIYRGGILGSLGTRVKINNNYNSGLVVPAVSSYGQGTTTCGAVVYAGSGPTNVYYDGECLITGINPVYNETPSVYSLQQNYPNPFNPVTNIKFSIPKAGLVNLIIYDITGKVISTLVNEQKSAGTYNVDFNAADFASGVYFYKLTSGDFSDVKKMVLVK